MSNGLQETSEVVASEPKGMLNFRPKPEDWERLIDLKHMLEKRQRTILTISEVVREAIRQCFNLNSNIDAHTPAPMTPRPTTATTDPCSRCDLVPDGDWARCDYCQRSLAATVFAAEMVSKGEAKKNHEGNPSKTTSKATKKPKKRTKKGE